MTRGASRVKMAGLRSLMRRFLPSLSVALCVGLVGCKFEPRSSDFECATQTDCSGGRVCVNHFCVESDGSVTPGDGGPDGSFNCPAGCSRCDQATCVIACDLADSCATPIVCPAGADCRIECNERNTCGGGIDCTQAASCRIQCIGSDSCTGAIVCGPGRCRVECTGTATCVAGVDCSTACACDTFCAGGNSCLPTPPICSGPAQCDNGTDCSSMAGPCDTCL
jgi:hypothetical protein